MSDSPLQDFAVGDKIIVDASSRGRGRVVEVYTVAKVNPKSVNVYPYGDNRITRYSRTGTTVFGTSWDRHDVISFPADDPRADEALAYRRMHRARLGATKAMRDAADQGLTIESAQFAGDQLTRFILAAADYKPLAPQTWTGR